MESTGTKASKSKPTSELLKQQLDRLLCENIVGVTPSALQGGFSQLEGMFKELGLEGFEKLAAFYVTSFRDASPEISSELTLCASGLLEFFSREVEKFELGAEPSGGSAEWMEKVAGLSAGLMTRKREAAEAVNFGEDREFIAEFIMEALDHLQAIEGLVLQIEGKPDDKELLDSLFRPFHTVKGNASALGLIALQDVAHKVEGLLDLARLGKHRVGRPEIEIILKAVDLVRSMLGDLRSQMEGKPALDLKGPCLELMTEVDLLLSGRGKGDRSPVFAGAIAEPPVLPNRPIIERSPGRRESDREASNTVKVDTGKLDHLIDMIGELVIVQSMIRQDPALENLIESKLSKNLSQLNQITAGLQKDAMSLRMVPIRQTFQKMTRLVRDLSSRAGKNVVLVLAGEDTELDRKMVEEINDPLVHMIRNAVDHGVESPLLRAERGKPPIAQLTLSAYHQGGVIVIELEDDGNGLDPEKIRRKALSLGLISSGQTLTEAEAYRLLFAPGFSTAETVTEVSGRGVGMDVALRNVQAVRGQIDVQSTLGQGTTFRLKLPLTLAILDGFILGVGSERLVLPMFSVKESLRPTREQVHTLHGRDCMVQVRGSLIPMVRLSTLFSIPTAVEDPTEGTLVLIEDNGEQLCLLVDRLIGKQEVVIKSLGETFSQVRGLAGGAILPDGRVGLILDANGIFKMCGLQKRREAFPESSRANNNCELQEQT